MENFICEYPFTRFKDEYTTISVRRGLSPDVNRYINYINSDGKSLLYLAAKYYLGYLRYIK